MKNKLIVLMVDGVSAAHYAAHRAQLPHFASLEARGFRVENLRAEVLGTSLPGRTSMMTGATADKSGVYGNMIWDGEQFRYANPDDVRVPTLPARAKAAGLDVAVVGFGMVRPEDTTLFVPPWWTGAFIQRARDAEPQQSGEVWLRVANHVPGERFERICAAAGVPTALPALDTESPAASTFRALINDTMMAEWVGVLAASDDAPDLILAEFLVTDTIQHYTGFGSTMSNWSVMQADMALGRILERLRAAGVEDEWNIAVMSDHGHSNVETALHPQVILPGVTVQCEGGSLIVAPKSDEELASVAERLAVYGVEPYANDCIPPHYRDTLKIFVAPPGFSFENDNPAETEPTGKPTALSTHGLRPGFTGDNRFALFAGPNVPQGRIDSAIAAQVAPTLAHIAGLPLDGFEAAPIWATAHTAETAAHTNGTV